MKILLAVSFAAFCLTGVPSVFAHHGYAAYDNSKTVTLIGTVTDFEMANPHSSLLFDVKNEKGEIEHWAVEFGYVRALKEQGWSPDTLKPGDQVSVTLHVAKNGSHVGSGGKITYADGRPLPLNPPAQ